jgi:hypothetical protein
MAAILESTTLRSSTKEDVFIFLENINMDKKPYFIELEMPRNDELTALKYIEQYLISHRKYKVPYAIYVQSKEKYISKYFRSVDKYEDCPLFYRKRTKLLSVKEQKIQNRIDLKTKKLNNIDLLAKAQIITNHAKQHKSLHTACEEGRILEQLLTRLSNQNN